MIPYDARASSGKRTGGARAAIAVSASTVVRVLGEVGAAVAGTRSSLLTALGGLGQLAAAGVFVVNMWTRVRMPGGVAPPQPLR